MFMNEEYTVKDRKIPIAMNEKRIDRLSRMIHDSNRIVAICGLGMMIEAGVRNVNGVEADADFEEKYGYLAEEIFSVEFFSTKKEIFYQFYKEELLPDVGKTTAAFEALKELDQRGKLSACITANIFGSMKNIGIRHVIEYRGSVNDNKCKKCGRSYSAAEVIQMKGVPRCEVCVEPLRPQVTLSGEMIRNDVLTRAADSVKQADLLLVLGTNLNHETVKTLVQYYEGERLVLITKYLHQKDKQADLLIQDEVQRVLPKVVWQS